MPAAASAVAAAAALLLAATPAPVQLRLQDPALDESSGLAVSARHPGTLWTHNDGGDRAQVVALDRRGRSVATVTLAGVDPSDPEALAPGPGPGGRPALFLGDIGDNLLQRPDVSVFRFPEPARLGDQTVPATWFRFRYPDGPHDAEALLVDRTGRVWIATKGISGQGLYRAPRRLVPQDEGTNPLTRVAAVPSLVTDGAFLPDGRLVLRTYASVYVYDRPGREVAHALLPPQPQGESLAVDGSRLLVGSEGAGSEVLAVPVPTSHGPPARSGGRPTAAPERPTTARGSDPAAGQGLVLAGGLTLLVVLGTAVGALVRHRR